MLGRNASTVSREIRRSTWFPSNESESYRPYRSKRLKTDPWTGKCYIAAGHARPYPNGRRQERIRPLEGRQHGRRGMQPAHRG